MHHSVDEDARGDDAFGIDGAEREDLRRLHDRHLSGSRHQRCEVARGLVIDDVAVDIASVGLLVNRVQEA